MRQWISWVLVMALCVVMASVSGVSVPAATYVQGDVNGDGKVTTYDARVLMVNILNDFVMTDVQKAAADITADGKLSTSDVRFILLAALMGESTEYTIVDLLPPAADDWNNPVQAVNKVYCTVKQSEDAAGGYQLINVTERDLGQGGTMANPYTWPYTAYAYDTKILVSPSARIEYDITVSSEAASFNLYLGGYIPHIDDGKGPFYVSINSLIDNNLNSVSGDLRPGTYTGSIAVADILSSGKDFSECMVDGNLWISGIKIYAVGYDGQAVTVRKFSVNRAVEQAADIEPSSDSMQAIRPSLLDSSEMVGLATVQALELYENGSRTTASTMGKTADYKKIYKTVQSQRVVNYADGYQLDMPVDWTPDYSLSALRSRYTSKTCVLTVSKEEESPYGNTAAGWNTYLTEWINPYISDQSFISQNYMRYLRGSATSQTILPGYTVMTYDIAIDWQGQIDLPYYSIAIIRRNTTYNAFYLMVLKSAAPTDGMIDRLIRSFKEVTVIGTAVNTQGQYQPMIPSSWSEETKAYYNKLVTQDTTDWGFFSASMLEADNENYDKRYTDIVSEKNRLETAIGQSYDIMPTYTHLSYGTALNDFPLEMATEIAGGNGYNGKPVLQFTYQYTMTNNTKLNGPTPVFNVLRGDYDAHFRQFARDIKAYGKPVLFRLNNEMNTDWTSYSGIVSLLDPDIFAEGWRRLYDIFEEEGVDNCIWIFNPFTPTYPKSSWGDPLCFMPGEEYVQILGLTYYEMGNESSVKSFQSMYTDVYNINKGYFINYPWIISEFACGAGGEKKFDWDTDSWVTTSMGRNWYQQYYWITAMFQCLNNRSSSSYAFCKNIKGAVWFNANDYTNINGTDYVVNYLKLDESSTYALYAFKSGMR